jgi:uncharacterized membrane protein YdbT with pleckstrin-like domain
VGYAEHNLISGEVITFRGRLHWIVLVRAIAVTLLMDIAGVLAIVLGATERAPQAFILLGLALLLISGVFMGSAVLARNAAEFVITNKRVIVKLGIVRKRTAEMFLHKVESIGVDQTVAGRIVGFGTISINGTGGTTESFQTIANPFEFRRQVQEQIGAASGGTFGASSKN